MSRTVAQRFYSRWAGVYDCLASHAPGVRRLRRHAVDALDPQPGDVVVDLGCGTGANFPFLREAVGPDGTVVGVDFSAGVLARARSRAAGWENVHVVRGDATELPIERADAVFGSFLSGMLDAPTTALTDWCSLVGSGGRVGLIDLARSTGRGRPLNPVFAALVRLSSPPGTAEVYEERPVAVLDRRVAAAHQRLHEECTATTFEIRLAGFARVSAGHVE